VCTYIQQRRKKMSRQNVLLYDKRSANGRWYLSVSKSKLIFITMIFVYTKVRITDATNATTVNNTFHLSYVSSRVLHLQAQDSTQVHTACETVNLRACNLPNSLRARSTVKFSYRWITHEMHLKRVATLPCDLSLITMHGSECCYFFDINISQGNVASHLRCDGIM